MVGPTITDETKSLEIHSHTLTPRHPKCLCRRKLTSSIFHIDLLMDQRIQIFIMIWIRVLGSRFLDSSVPGDRPCSRWQASHKRKRTTKSKHTLSARSRIRCLSLVLEKASAISRSSRPVLAHTLFLYPWGVLQVHNKRKHQVRNIIIILA